MATSRTHLCNVQCQLAVLLCLQFCRQTHSLEGRLVGSLPVERSQAAAGPALQATGPHCAPPPDRLLMLRELLLHVHFMAAIMLLPLLRRLSDACCHRQKFWHCLQLQKRSQAGQRQVACSLQMPPLAAPSYCCCCCRSVAGGS